MDLAWLTLAALLAVVVVSCTARVNPGVVALVLAGAVAVYAAPRYGQPLGLAAVVAGFPADLFLTLVGVSLLFTQAQGNGTLATVAGAAQACCRGNVGLIPVMFFLLALGVGSAGPGNIAAAGLIAPVAMASAHRCGIPPFLMAVMAGHGAVASMLSPFTPGGVVANAILADMELGGHEWRVYAANAGANAAAAFAGYLLFGGWRLFRSRHAGGPPADPVTTRFTWRHGLTVAVVAAVVAGVVVGKAHLGLAAFAGAAALAVLRLADEQEALVKLPWGVILMVCGVSVLTSLLDRTGGTLRFAELIAAVSTPRTVTFVVALVVGLVSIYSSTTGVVLPAFLPVVKDLARVQAGSDPLALALAVLVGGSVVDVSPLSTIGALCVAGAPAGVDRRALARQLFAWGFAMALVGALLCWAVL